MSQRDPNGATGDESAGGVAAELAESGREYAPEPPRSVRGGIDSGAVAAVGAGAALVAGLRALRRGDGQSGVTRLLAGGVLAIVAVAQRRSTRDRERDRPGVEETDVVDTAPDVEGVARKDEATTAPRSTGDEASEVVSTSPDIEAVEPNPDADSDAEADPEAVASESDVAVEEFDVGAEESDVAVEESDVPGAGSFDRVGEAAFDEQSGRIPAPQEAFNRRLLSSGAEVFWGVRAADGLVVVSGDYDRVEDAEGISYVASSEVDDDRGVRVPDTLLNHWDDVAGGGTAVVSGTGLAFGTADDPALADLLVVVPEQWADEVLGTAEE